MSRLRPLFAALARGRVVSAGASPSREAWNPLRVPTMRRAALEMLELHLWPRAEAGTALDLVIARAAPRRGPALVDLGLLVDDGTPWAGATRAESPAPLVVDLGGALLHAELGPMSAPPRGRAHAARAGASARVELELAPLVRRPGLVLGAASGQLIAFGRTITVEDSLILVLQRRIARRPYAWARAALRGSIDGLPLVCTVETARRRAGSVVLPELGRLRLFGPGTARLPRACSLAPLPLRAEYGTGRLRAAALAPGLRLEVELEAPPART